MCVPALQVVKVRSHAMQEASEMVPSGMASVFIGPQSKLGLACQLAKEWCKKQGIENPECTVSNYLYPGCKVIAGNQEVY